MTLKRTMKAVTMAVTVALAFGFTGANAATNPNHAINGNGISFPYVVTNLSALELPQTGTVTINGSPYTIFCVSVIAFTSGTHYVEMAAVDASGSAVLSLTIREATPTSFLTVAPAIASGNCGSGGTATPGPGIFTIV